MSRPAIVTINQEALIHNLSVIRNIAPKSKMVAVVKANAYGHGVSNLISAMNHADMLGVSCLEEALELKKSGAEKNILIMQGIFSSDELPILNENNFSVVIHQMQQVETILNANLSKPLKVWLKLNTGMNRLGFQDKEFLQAYEKLFASDKIVKPIVLMTHFTSADEENNSSTEDQIQQFADVTKNLKGEKSLANSAGILAWSDSHGDWNRPGLMLYGVSPFADKTGIELGLKPVMTLQTKIMAIQDCRAGDKVGYGGIWQCPEDMRIGVAAMGYADGYPRNAKNGTPILLNGKIVPLVGRVSMDMLTVDLRTQKDAKVGDVVTLWGEGLPVEIISQHSGILTYELLCGINKRVRVVAS